MNYIDFKKKYLALFVDTTGWLCNIYNSNVYVNTQVFDGQAYNRVNCMFTIIYANGGLAINN